LRERGQIWIAVAVRLASAYDCGGMEANRRIALRTVAVVALLSILAFACWEIYRKMSFWTAAEYQAVVSARQYDRIRWRIAWSQPKDRMQAMQALCQSDDKEAFDILLENSRSNEMQIRLAIAHSLETLTPAKRTQLGAILLLDSNPTVVEVARMHLDMATKGD